MDETKEIEICFYLALYRPTNKYALLNDAGKVGLTTKWVTFGSPFLSYMTLMKRNYQPCVPLGHSSGKIRGPRTGRGCGQAGDQQELLRVLPEGGHRRRLRSPPPEICAVPRAWGSRCAPGRRGLCSGPLQPPSFPFRLAFPPPPSHPGTACLSRAA